VNNYRSLINKNVQFLFSFSLSDTLWLVINFVVESECNKWYQSSTSCGAMVEGTCMSQMGDSIATMKMQMEKYGKEFERIDNKAKQRNANVDRRFDEAMDKLTHMTEMMVAHKKPKAY
jgi:hypothetical protein